MAASTPSRTWKNPSAVRSPVKKRRSYSSQSLVSSVALFASVRAIRIVSTPHTSVARRAAEPRLGVGHERRKPVDRLVALHVRDLVGALESIVEATQQRGDGIGGIEALVGVHLERVIRVGGHLPAAYVDRFEPRLHLLNGLIPRDGGEHGDVCVILEQLPQASRAVPGERVLDGDRAPQAVHVARRVRSGDALPAAPCLTLVREGGDELLLIHGYPSVMGRAVSVQTIVRRRRGELSKVRAGSEASQNPARHRKLIVAGAAGPYPFG